MQEVMTVASIPGIAGVIASFLLFFFLEKMGFSQSLIQTLIFLKLSVAGHSTLYTTRTSERHFWKKPWPSPKLFIPTFSTQIAATIVAVYGLFMAAVGWKYFGFIWLYGIVWFLINNYLKVWTFKWLRANREKGTSLEQV
jgi:H+-transporting ATPase